MNCAFPRVSIGFPEQRPIRSGTHVLCANLQGGPDPLFPCDRYPDPRYFATSKGMLNLRNGGAPRAGSRHTPVWACLAAGWAVYFSAALWSACAFRYGRPGSESAGALAVAGAVLAAFSFLILRACRSERRKIREAEAANAELVRQRAHSGRAAEEADAFLHLAAHDMQAPLRHVSGFVQLLLAQPGFPEDPSSRKYAGYIHEGIERMSAMIAGLVEFGRIGKAETGSAKADFNEVIGKAARMLSEDLASAGGELLIAGSLPTVTGNKAYLEKLAHHLLRNCIQYRYPERPLRIRVTPFARDGETGFRVEDNGLGIAAEAREKVFEPFKRLHGYDTIKGCGLGLSLSRRIAEKCGGRMFLEDGALGGIAVVTAFPVS